MAKTKSLTDRASTMHYSGAHCHICSLPISQETLYLEIKLDPFEEPVTGHLECVEFFNYKRPSEEERFSRKKEQERGVNVPG